MKRFISFALCFVLVISFSVIGASAYNIGADGELSDQQRIYLPRYFFLRKSVLLCGCRYKPRIFLRSNC